MLSCIALQEFAMFKKLTLAFGLFIALSGALFAASIDRAQAGDTSSVAVSGVFEGRSDHVTKGGVSIVKTASGYVAILEPDFSLDGAPAPRLGFAKDGKYDPKSEFAKLANKDGLQAYAIPAHVNPAAYNEFVVWCADFSVPLGVAVLK